MVIDEDGDNLTSYSLERWLRSLTCHQLRKRLAHASLLRCAYNLFLFLYATLDNFAEVAEPLATIRLKSDTFFVEQDRALVALHQILTKDVALEAGAIHSIRVLSCVCVCCMACLKSSSGRR